jgi:hypothetical protein
MRRTLFILITYCSKTETFNFLPEAQASCLHERCKREHQFCIPFNAAY